MNGNEMGVGCVLAWLALNLALSMMHYERRERRRRRSPE